MMLFVFFYHNLRCDGRRGGGLSVYISNVFKSKVIHPSSNLSQPRHVTASLPSPCDNNQSTGGRSERTQCQAKMDA